MTNFKTSSLFHYTSFNVLLTGLFVRSKEEVARLLFQKKGRISSNLINRKLFLLFTFMVYVVCITAQNNMNSWCERNEEFNIVCLYLKQDKPDKADSLLKVIEQNKIHTSSDTAFYLYNICKGSYYYQKDNYEQAINYLLNAKKITDDNFEILDPEYIEMIAVLSDIFFKDNNGVGTPAYATYLHNRGKLFLDKKQYNESVKYLTESLELQKKQGKILPQTQQYVEEVKQYIK